MKKFNSYQEYAQMLIKDIIALENIFPKHEQLPSTLFTYWCEEINNQAEQYWKEHILGKRKSYMFDDSEFREVFDKAGTRYTSEIVDELVEEGYVQMGISGSGEIVYSATEKGKQALSKSKFKYL